MIKKLKNIVRSTYVIIDLKGGEIFECLTKKNYKRRARVEKIIKRKGDKLYVKCKGYDSSFNSWIDKKDIV